MSLRDDAIKLTAALNQIVSRVLGNRSDTGTYRGVLAERLAPIVEAYDNAVFVRCSREEASEALSDLSGYVEALSASFVHGDLKADIAKPIHEYWRLYTIFRESRYRHDTL